MGGWCVGMQESVEVESRALHVAFTTFTCERHSADVLDGDFTPYTLFVKLYSRLRSLIHGHRALVLSESSRGPSRHRFSPTFPDPSPLHSTKDLTTMYATCC